eukprot:13360-Heterococcus_DN1.PRE.1
MHSVAQRYVDACNAVAACVINYFTQLRNNTKHTSDLHYHHSLLVATIYSSVARCSNSGEQHAGQLKAVIVTRSEAAVAEIAASPDNHCVTACATIQQS